MNKMTKVLIAVLAGQICLVLFLSTDLFNSEEGNSKEKVLTTNLKSTDSILIEDKTGPSTLTLKKEGKSWTVPGVMGFPASTKSVESLINKFTDMDGGWPVATTKDAAKRFKVDKDDYEMSISYQSKGKNLAQLFIGTAPNYKVRHVRASNSNKIYSVSLSPTDLSTKAKEWIDKSAYTVNSNDIKKVETKEFTLSQKKGSWELDGIAAGEVTNQTIAGNTVDTLSSIVFKSVESDKADPEYGLEAPLIEFSIVKKDGQKIDYAIGERKVNDGYILHSSDKKFYVSIDKYVIENIKKLNRISLVAKKTLKDAKSEAKKVEANKESSEKAKTNESAKTK